MGQTGVVPPKRLAHCLVAALTLASSFAGASCTNGEDVDEPTAAGAADTPCKLLTKRDVSAYVNAPERDVLVDSRASTQGPVRAVAGTEWCAARKDFVEVYVGLASALAKEGFRSWEEGAREREVKLDPVKGLGDRALWHPGPYGAAYLSVLDGKQVVTILIYADEANDTLRLRSVKLAERALARL